MNGLNILIPQFKPGMTGQAWFERSLREGNFLAKLMEKEKAQTGQRMAKAATAFKGYERKKGSELCLEGVMDARTFMRWQIEHPEALQDINEYRKLVRDNPEMRPWGKQL